MSKDSDQSINEVESAMQELLSSLDVEAHHVKADQLLVKLVRLLTTNKKVEQIERILKAYEDLDKWYA